ncbi:MAG: tetratricopeptide repeat protein [Acetobacteraceae bacterium]
MASYGQALSLQPDRPDIWNDRGVALKMLSRFDAATESFRQAIRFKPDFPDALLNLAVMDCLEGRQSEALDYIAKSLAIDARIRGRASCR